MLIRYVRIPPFFWQRRSVRIVLVVITISIVLAITGIIFNPGRPYPSKDFSSYKHSEDYQSSDQSKGQFPHSRLNIQQDYFTDVAGFPSCGNAKELFSLSPLQLEDFTFITPLGLLSPTAHVFPSPHLYFNVRKLNPNNYDSLPVEVPVIAPTDITIFTIKHIEAKGRPDYDDSMFTFGVCTEVKAYFDHLKTLAPKIKEAFEKAPITRCDEYSLSYPREGKIDFKLCEKSVNVKIPKDEQVGTAGGGEGQKVFDFGVFDKRVTAKQFANPKRWVGREHFVYLSCALDYYSEPLRSKLKERLGGFGQKGEVKGVDCGEVIQDVSGTAMGAWVPPGTDAISHEPPYLALVHDYIEPQYLVFSMGDSAEKAGLPHGKYTFLPRNEGFVNRHFRDVKSDDNIYCFETEDTYEPNVKPKVNILLTMLTPEKLRIEKLNSPECGSGPWQMKNYVEFER